MRGAKGTEGPESRVHLALSLMQRMNVSFGCSSDLGKIQEAPRKIQEEEEMKAAKGRKMKQMITHSIQDFKFRE